MAKKESKQDMPAAPVVVQTPKVSFDAWWAMTNKKLPPQHRKEVVLADFNSRGLSKNESIGSFNQALEQYGVKLK